MNIRFAFSTSNAWYSRLIRDASKAKVSHTFVIVPALGTELVFQEGALGWSVCTLASMQDSIVKVVTPKYPVDVGFAKSLTDLGQPYDYLGLLGMAWVMFWRWLGHKVRNPLASAHAMFCSERGTRILQDSNYPGADKLDPAATTPEDLLDFLENS
jgi:hypothetical protein